MAKKGSNGGTPIQFRVSENIDGKGGRVPVPVNQPGWKYGNPGYRSRPGFFEWLLIGLITTLIAIFIFVVITTNSSEPSAWVMSVLCALIPALSIVSAVSRTIYYTKEANSGGRDKSPKKRKKK